LVLSQFDGEHLRRPHSNVQELDDFTQFGRNAVGDEKQADPTRLQIRLDGRPIGFPLDVRAKFLRKSLVRLPLRTLAPFDETLSKRFRGPVSNGVRRVIHHLPDDLAANACIRAPPYLDERRHAVLVEEQVIERTAPRFARLACDRILAVDEDKSTRIRGVNLIPGEQRGELGEQVLEIVLRCEARRLHRDQRRRAGQDKYSCVSVDNISPFVRLSSAVVASSPSNRRPRDRSLWPLSPSH
jgi:hypothetical protein